MRLRVQQALLGLAFLPWCVQAVERCDIDGQSVNPSHGGTTAGKTGLMRCRAEEDGTLVREQEIRNGVFMGVVRYFKAGVLAKEYSVNERGNRDGLARDFAATPGATNQVLREETLRNSTTVGLARSWDASGRLRRVSFHGDDGRELALAEFTAQGKLADLRCGNVARLAPSADDGAWCGHGGQAATVELFAERGALRGRLVHQRGELRRSETLWDNGAAREVAETRADGGSERSYSAEGRLRREVEWVATAASGEARARRTTVLDREFHESGVRVRERRWTPTERGARLATEASWYLNGQPRATLEYRQDGEQASVLETSFHDNGQRAAAGSYQLAGRYDRTATGVHQRFDEQGRLRGERHFDAQGRLQREREFDDAGKPTRDDEVFADGSRKAYAR